MGRKRVGTVKRTHRKPVGTTDRRAIRKRLDGFIRRHFKSWHEFEKLPWVRPATAKGWRNAKNPTPPDTVSLLRFARQLRLNPTWLLLGEGPELLPEPADDPKEQLRAALAPEIALALGMPAGEAHRLIPKGGNFWKILVLDTLLKWVNPFREHQKELRSEARGIDAFAELLGDDHEEEVEKFREQLRRREVKLREKFSIPPETE